MGRAPCCDKVGLKKGPWTPEEDRVLINYIQRHGHENWRALPKKAGLLRCGKSCRLRWINYLRPDIKRGNFTEEEENTIIQLHEIMGNRWSAIAARLPRRTDNEIKNVWHTHLKKRLPKYQTSNIKTTKQQQKSQTPNSNEKHSVTLKGSSTNLADSTPASTTSTSTTTNTNDGATNNPSSGCFQPNSPQQSSSDVSSATTEISRDFDFNIDLMQFDYHFPMIDETFWSQDFLTNDMKVKNLLSGTSDDWRLQFPANNNIVKEDASMDFWHEIFFKAGDQLLELP